MAGRNGPIVSDLYPEQLTTACAAVKQNTGQLTLKGSPSVTLPYSESA